MDTFEIEKGLTLFLAVLKWLNKHCPAVIPVYMVCKEDLYSLVAKGLIVTCGLNPLDKADQTFTTTFLGNYLYPGIGTSHPIIKSSHALEVGLACLQIPIFAEPPPIFKLNTYAQN